MFLNWATDKEITRFWGWEPHKDIEETKSLLQGWIDEYSKEDCYHWVIILKETSQAIGYIYINEIDSEEETASIHSLVSRKYWNKGLATEACKAVLAFAFTEIGINKIRTRHHVKNPASGKVLQKSGMRFSGIAYKHFPECESLSGDYCFYEISKNEWLSIRPMLAQDIDIIINNFTEQGWSKPRDVLENYLTTQNDGKLFVFVAEYKGEVAGYATLYPCAENGPFAGKSVPEISDFNVFIKFQRNGIGKAILDAAEKKASELSDTISLGVGLHYGYGQAQRIYAKRGYIPDGSGVWYKNTRLEQYATCKNDDDLVLYMSKKL